MQDLHDRVSKLEVKVDENRRKIIAQEDKNEQLTKINILIEQQQQINKDHATQMKKFDETLNKVNTNLDGLNKNLEILDNRVGKLEESENGNTINMPNLGTKIIIGIFMAIPTLITAWLLIQFNLK